MAGPGQGTWTYSKGKISLLRVTHTGDSFGSGDDMLSTEVIVQLEGNDKAFGFDLHVGDKELPNHLGMLSVLRDAYIHDLPVVIGYWLEEGKKCGYIGRIEFTKVS